MQSACNTEARYATHIEFAVIQKLTNKLTKYNSDWFKKVKIPGKRLTLAISQGLNLELET